MTQRMIEITSPTFLAEDALPAPLVAADLFGNDRPLALEIGCGIGDFILELARQQPQTNFLAIDIYNKGCFKTCKLIDAAGLTNVRVVRAEARYLLSHYLKPQNLSAIYINCPDPWPKKRHRKRRLVNRNFLQLAHYYLRPGGELYFSTDFEDYAQQVAETLPGMAGFANALEVPLATALPGYPLSKYMRRFLDLGQPIYFIHYRRQTEPAAAPASPPQVASGYRIPWSRVENG